MQGAKQSCCAIVLLNDDAFDDAMGALTQHVAASAEASKSEFPLLCRSPSAVEIAQYEEEYKRGLPDGTTTDDEEQYLEKDFLAAIGDKGPRIAILAEQVRASLQEPDAYSTLGFMFFIFVVFRHHPGLSLKAAMGFTEPQLEAFKYVDHLVCTSLAIVGTAPAYQHSAQSCA